MADVGLIPKRGKVAEIGAAYARASAQILSELRSISIDDYTIGRAAAVKSNVAHIVDELNMKARKWSDAAIRSAYESAAADARARLLAIGAKKAKRFKADRHSRSIGKMADKTFADLFAANATIESNAAKYLAALGHAKAKVDEYAQAQAFDSAEVRKFIDRTVKTALKYKDADGSHLPSKAIAKKIFGRLEKAIDGADFIEINGRSYNLKSYSDLVARTRMRESQTDAVINSCAEYGNDLVQFSKHDKPCEICAPYEGNIYSLSGNDPDYERLPDEARCPVHPNCEHNLNPTSRTALKWR